MVQTFTGPSLLDVIESVPYSRYLWRTVRLPLALLFAVLAQSWFIAHRTDASGGIVWLLAAILLFLIAFRLDRFEIRRGEALTQPSARVETGVRRVGVATGTSFSALTYLTSSHNTFTSIGVFFWIMSVLAWLYAFWDGPIDLRSPISNLLNWLRSPSFTLRLSRSLALFLLMMAVAVFIRYYRLDAVPPEMTSDHVEKLLDVNDVLNGQHSIFFPRNTGREPLQMYLSAWIAMALGTGLTHLTLKIGSALAAALTIPFVYLLGKELGDEGLGLIAGTLMAVALWPQTISRVGLRFPFSPAFVAPVLYFLLRGLRRGARNDFLWTGLFLGAGLYGYTSFRIAPLLVALAALPYVLWRRFAQGEREWPGRLVMMGVIALAVFIPLFHYSLEAPEMFWYRVLGRVGETEAHLPGPPLLVFLSNEWNSIRMFNWTSDAVWVNTVPGRPVLDTLAGGTFVLGVAYLLYRFVTRPNWTDAVLLFGVPVLLLPSTMSLAFPGENPSVARSAGAMPLVFLIAAFPLRMLAVQMVNALGARLGRVVGIGAIVVALWFSGREMFHQYYEVYPRQYLGGAQNASEIGRVVRNFAESFGTYDTVWVRAYPYWVDTRAVGIYAGRFGWDNVILDNAEFANTVAVPGTKLFILKHEDVEAVQALRQLYPNGLLAYHASRFPGKNYLTFLVPAAEDFDENQLLQP